MTHAVVPAGGTVNKWCTQVQAWRLQRRRRALVAWEQKRAKGQTSFVVRSALIYSLIMTASSDFLGVGLAGETRFANFLFNAITYTIGGFFVGYIGWSAMEHH